MRRELRNLSGWMRASMSVERRFLILSIVCGLFCGVVAVLFHLSIDALFENLWHFASSQPPGQFIAVMIAAPTLAGLLVGIVTQRWIPEAVGSGIPQTKEAYYNRGGKVRSIVALARFALGTIYIGLGNSLGREGPTVHMSSAIASRLGRWSFRDPERVRAMMPVGMAAGIGAAFNTPLSAITFVFEELLDNFSMKALGSIVIAVVIASAVSRSILGDAPILSNYLDLSYSTSLWMLVAIPIGLTSGVMGHFFVTSVLRTRLTSRRITQRCAWIAPALGGFVCGIIGLAAFAITDRLGTPENTVFSIGYHSVGMAFEAKLAAGVMAVLFICKFIAVVVNYSTGGSGGLFSPTLFLGALFGGLVGILLVQFHQLMPLHGWPGTEKVIGGCVLLGMGAFFGSVVRCPMTSLLIIFEITGNYSLILPLMAGNMLSWGVATRLRPIPLYDSLLLQDGVNLRRLPAYRGSQDYQHLPVSTIMTHDVDRLFHETLCADALPHIRALPRRHRSYPIVDQMGGFCGMVSHLEIEQAEPETQIGDLIQASQDHTITLDTPIRTAAKRMLKDDIRQLAVTSSTDDRTLHGIITLNDITRQQNEAD